MGIASSPMEEPSVPHEIRNVPNVLCGMSVKRGWRKLSEQGLLLHELPGIAKRRKDLLARLGIHTVDDLISFFPRNYEDWTAPKTLLELTDGTVETFVARISQKPALQRKGRMSILRTVLRDDSNAAISCTWFNQPYLESKIIKGEEYLFRGKVKRNGVSFEIVNPTFEPYEPDQAGIIKPVYPLTSGLSQGVLRQLILEAFSVVRSRIEEPLSDETRKMYHLCAVEFAYEKIHHPQDREEYEIARRRLVFEELFLIQAGLRLIKSTLTRKTRALPLVDPKNRMEQFYRQLPFTLTESQEQVIKETLRDMTREIPMNRLIQGDVGSGKTVIAAAAIVCCSGNKAQAALLAPTAVLAGQHFITMQNFFKGFDIRIALLTGSVTGKKKADLLERLKNGEIDLLIGTHSILEGPVQFKNLALTVTDEQHRFGVKQRSLLSQDDETSPHVLVMSATPIPRTLGLILYGDLDISILRGLPGGRKPIETYTARSKDDARIYDLLDRQMKEGRQVYIVCPMIESSQESDLTSVKELYDKIVEEIFPHWQVGLLHGGLPEKTKAKVMSAFMAGETQALVSTTVIEVGIDNPNASIMLVQNAERFGLAQLHQLRGRIGRGPYRSICILKSDSDADAAKERLRILCKSTDGFEIAEKDMQLRGIGDFFGTRQHGIPEMKIANLYQDTAILKETQEALNRLFKADPLLELPGNRALVPSIKRRFGELFDHVGI
jgi:ATP-dependent DNA helicase RecG